MALTVVGLSTLAASPLATAAGGLPPSPAQLLPAREQMALTLGFHIILVPFALAFTMIMLLANYRGVRHNDREALLLAERWSKVVAVLFAVGAVSGTVLTFEMGLLWPRLMGTFGAAYGIPFAVEGIFFFLEAIFISVYIYGWKRLPPWPHLWSGIPVVLAGVGGTASVVAANGWMNLPGGMTIRAGRVVDVQPLAVYFNRAFWYESIHMLLAAYLVAGFLVASVYAVGLLRGRRDRYHRLGLLMALSVASLAMPLQIFTGDLATRQVFHNEPAKFAAIELLPRTGDHVPETLGGVMIDGQPRYGVKLPSVASVLAGFSPDTRIPGLDAVPPASRSTDRLATTVHLSFDTMVGASFVLLALSIWFAATWTRRRDLPDSRWFLRGVAASGALAVIALEAGWIVTEVGRQPWTIVGYLFTRDAVTTSGNLWWSLGAVIVVYAAIGTGTVWVLRRMSAHWRSQGGAPERSGGNGATDGRDDEFGVPYGPTAPLPVASPAGTGTTRVTKVTTR